MLLVFHLYRARGGCIQNIFHPCIRRQGSARFRWRVAYVNLGRDPQSESVKPPDCVLSRFHSSPFCVMGMLINPKSVLFFYQGQRATGARTGCRDRGTRFDSFGGSVESDVGVISWQRRQSRLRQTTHWLLYCRPAELRCYTIDLNETNGHRAQGSWSFIGDSWSEDSVRIHLRACLSTNSSDGRCFEYVPAVRCCCENTYQNYLVQFRVIVEGSHKSARPFLAPGTSYCISAACVIAWAGVCLGRWLAG